MAARIKARREVENNKANFFTAQISDTCHREETTITRRIVAVKQLSFELPSNDNMNPAICYLSGLVGD